MNLADLSYQFTRLEDSLYDLDDAKSKKGSLSSIHLPKSLEPEEHAEFIKQRLQGINDQLSRIGRTLTVNEISLFPAWDKRFVTLAENLLNEPHVKSDAALKSAVEATKEHIDDIRSRILHRDEVESPVPPSVLASHVVSHGAVDRPFGLLEDGIGALWRFVKTKTTSTVAQVGIASTPEEEAEIEVRKTSLTRESGGSEATLFASKLSEYTIAYLKEHILNIKEREPALRPAFLSDFFDDLRSENPIPTPMGDVVIKLLEQEADLKKVIETNLLLFLKNIYCNMDVAFTKTPYVLTSVLHETLSATLEDMQKEEKVTGETVGSQMGLVQRDLLLSGKVVNPFIQFIMKIGLPNGNDDLYIPSQGLSSVGKGTFPGAVLLRRVGVDTRQDVLKIIQKASAEIFQSAIQEMSENSDIQQELLLQGYRVINDYISPPKQEELATRFKKEALEGKLGIVEFFTALLSSLFRGAYKPSVERKKEDRTGGDKRIDLLQKKIEEGISFLLPDTKTGIFLKRRAGKTMAASISQTIAEQLREEMGGKKCVSTALDQLQSFIDPSKPRQELFPRTQAEIDVIQQKQQAHRENRLKDIEKEENRLKNNIPAIADRIVENIGFDTTKPTESELLSMNGVVRVFKHMTRMLKGFINNLLKTLVLGILKAIDFRSQIDVTMKKFRRSVEGVPQDAFAIFMIDWVGKNTRDVPAILEGPDKKK
jgi:hypothetical protein